MRSVVTSYVTASIDAAPAQNFLNDPKAIAWLTNVSAWQLTNLLSQGCQSGSYAVANAWKWISDAPDLFYQKRPSLLPDVFDSLILYTSQNFPQGVEISLSKSCDAQIRSRPGRPPGTGGENASVCARQCPPSPGRRCRGSFCRCLFGRRKKGQPPPSLFTMLFRSYDWDKGKDLRVSLVEAFLRSNWPPGVMAVAANNAGILPKIFKRLHRTHQGDDYLRAMRQDLSQRYDPITSKIGEHLSTLIADPDFYEE